MSLPNTFEAIYDRYAAFVRRSARRLGVPTPLLDDAVQEVFLVVHRQLPHFERRSSLRTWLFGIAHNVARELHRASRRKGQCEDGRTAVDLDQLAAPDEARPDEAAARAIDSSVLRSILDGLEDRQRDVFVLAELEELTAPEIARATRSNLSTVYSRLRLARVAFGESAARFRARQRANAGEVKVPI